MAASENTVGAETTLKDAFAGRFLVGAALNGAQYSGRDTLGAGLVAEQFNQVSPENVLKWESIHPEPGWYAFEGPDQYVEFGEAHDMFIVGHTLVWHSQTPQWVFQDADGNPASRDTLLARMRDHIHTVVGRYKGRVDGWDVVNEALNEDGTLRQSPWREIIGDDYIASAFAFAREADPDAELYYNDYSLPNPAKRDGAVALVRDLQERGVDITGIGMQGHYGLSGPSLALVDSSITAFAALGVDVMITELDIDVLPPAMRNQGANVSDRAEMSDALNPYADALPDSVQQALAQRYADLFGLFLDHSDHLTRVTFWGVTDGDSWKNNWPVRGRTNYPLLFDRAGQPKPAFDAVVAAVR
jgi:endo-1,4-beta-xylanase